MAPGVTLTVPARAPSHGPIPCAVTMVAEEATYVANRGILDTALEVLLVRRDAPGVRFLAKLDPDALMFPDPPLPPPPPPPPGIDPADIAPGLYTESRTLDPLDYDGRHPGAATYWALAAFARHHTATFPLAVTDPRGPLGPLPVSPAPVLPADAITTIYPLPGLPGVVARVVLRDGTPRVEGAFLGAVPVVTPPVSVSVSMSTPTPTPTPMPTVPFVTVVALRLEPTGGVSAGSFVLDPLPPGSAPAGRFSIPLASVAPRLAGGVIRVLVFAGDERADPVDVLLPDA